MRRLAQLGINYLLSLFKGVDYGYISVGVQFRNKDIPSNTVVVVGHKNFPKWVQMKCPCGCNETLTLSLMKKFRPSWSLETDFYNRVTLSPSVWKSDGCRSHFFVRKGKIVWVKE